jgi:hypothetical protein
MVIISCFKEIQVVPYRKILNVYQIIEILAAQKRRVLLVHHIICRLLCTPFLFT